jgi:hypothetical protein
MLPAGYTWSLTAIAVAAAVAMLWAFKHCSDQARILVAKRKIRGYLLAFRLFADEPAMLFKSQGQLLVWNLRYLALMLRPTAVTIIPLALLLFHLDAVYGRRPLHAGESAIVTAQVSGGPAQSLASLSLEGQGIAVETPPLRLPEERRVCWRVRALKGESGNVRLSMQGASVMKSVQAGAPAAYLSERRVSSLPEWLCYPGEARLPVPTLSSIAVEYPSAEINVFGFGVHWLVWFCVVSLIAMLVFRRWLRVTF